MLRRDPVFEREREKKVLIVVWEQQLSLYTKLSYCSMKTNIVYIINGSGPLKFEADALLSTIQSFILYLDTKYWTWHCLYPWHMFFPNWSNGKKSWYEPQCIFSKCTVKQKIKLGYHILCYYFKIAMMMLMMKWHFSLLEIMSIARAIWTANKRNNNTNSTKCFYQWISFQLVMKACKM